MTGEALAIVSAAFYGLAGAAIARGGRTARADNGLFLSILVTAAGSLALWLLFGRRVLPDLPLQQAATAIILFLLSGVASMVLGRYGMYAASVRIGAIRTSLYRRLIPVFALPVGFLLLSELPDPAVYPGAVLILGGVLLSLTPRTPGTAARPDASRVSGHAIAVASAGAYALAYALRRLGLDLWPDPLLGTFLGAAAGALWFLGARMFRAARPSTRPGLLEDRGPWQWTAAVTLAAGQTLQFLALLETEVATVALLGSLDILFTVAIAGFLFRTEAPPGPRIALAVLVAFAGTAVIFH
ncbi:DMT family transporter [Antarcticimicrobium luteum]|uniref:EamA family transporter n=1 Tax=Antarcticimicrobium luteum TaxID=2547397 RepID=A0A4R5VG47_9RHOB|nr:DMT family transporter [Antarcticimicrobium luteum]TDK51376.1 EamA family transporter [Antarcticimicrobium luteum]